ncbi:hypothetical protein, partial [Metapseudomonas otitidis]|uniref:hypothetical protein n=1 Tax=Metapseudomonas otitidis TaxID=319939 RepID=UPI002810AD4D
QVQGLGGFLEGLRFGHPDEGGKVKELYSMHEKSARLLDCALIRFGYLLGSIFAFEALKRR